ncbi:cation diffusion facilitator family transporter [Alteribacillus iranensis]|uniref:Cobalt-zinc-cadmium efflux system protein n=1 Tax=Alteribacillus iranensis TaxID=930128 RepID=A0A1I2BN31_9BACI|nr:cation diffusion facilitator family transporter [Alteribacillus iranensis]SFE57387.1 cobalt-zinc-cadmium efflux system protein [Alteribacillus iranensis]
MGHHHHHSHQNIKTAFFLNLGFTIIELIGGILTNSVAIISDAIHDLGDSISLGMSWFLQKKSNQGSDEQFTYGYRRFSLLGALINSIILIVGSLFVLSEAIPRLWDPEVPHAGGMFFLALLGMAVNGAAVLKLKSGTSMNEKVVSWHLMEDVLGWAAVFVVSIVMFFWEFPILDPLLATLITLYILYNVIKNVKKTLFIFLDGVPEEINPTEVEKLIKAIPHVKNTHHTHIWSLDGESHVLTVHVVLEGNCSLSEAKAVKRKVKQALQRYHFSHMTVEVEFSPDDCSQETLE